MADQKQLEVISRGVNEWNDWRKHDPKKHPDLNGADLSGSKLSQINLSYADLRRCNFMAADLSRADLSSARLCGANLFEADLRLAQLVESDLSEVDLRIANLSGAILKQAYLRGAKLSYADLTGVDLRGAYLEEARLDGANLKTADLRRTNLLRANLLEANLNEANLENANISGALVGGTTFASNDLSTILGLDTVFHLGPSTIGIDTLFKSNRKIPEEFLRGAGVPEDFITFIPSLVGRAIEFYSCFISYSHRDEEFSRRLHSRMREEDLRVWYAPEDMKAGRKLHEEIFRAIQIHDKLLLVLSENSMKSEWVMTEIRRAKTVERAEDRRKLFPIRLVDFETIQSWECFDADSSKDLATEVREYYIPDFSNWKDHDAFELEFAKLLTALRATEK